MTHTATHPANWLDQFFTDIDRNWRAPASSFKPAVDILEDRESFLVSAELPGVPKENISIEVKENRLVLSGKKESLERGEEGKYRHLESRQGSFTRTFELPRNVKVDAIDASFRDGVLTLRIPKAEEARAKTVEIR